MTRDTDSTDEMVDHSIVDRAHSIATTRTMSRRRNNLLKTKGREERIREMNSCFDHSDLRSTPPRSLAGQRYKRRVEVFVSDVLQISGRHRQCEYRYCVLVYRIVSSCQYDTIRYRTLE